jgi:hypothetical protein
MENNRTGGGLLKSKRPFVCVARSYADVVQVVKVQNNDADKRHMNKVTFFIVQVPFDKSQKLFFHSSFQFVSCCLCVQLISAMNN